MGNYNHRYLIIEDQNWFIFGPRGTGKSTFLNNQFSRALTFDLRTAEHFRMMHSNPDLLLKLIEERIDHKTIIIDEIQRVPDLLPVIHKAIESNKSLQFIMTGSSARKLKKQGIDLLAGRAMRKEMHPYMLTEIEESSITLEQLISYGMLPMIHGVIEEKRTGSLDAYVSLYMEQEVYQEALVRNIGDFAHFLEIVSLSHGSVLNLSNISRDCSVNRKTIESYVQILEDILLAFKIPVFSKKASRDITHHPKFYFFDCGVFQTLRPRGPLDHPAEIMGLALEGLVAQHLRAWISYTPQKNKLYFWRNRYHHEVDFILYGEIGLYAIEVKLATEIRKDDLKGIFSFIEEYPITEAMILYRGTEVLKKGNVWIIPVERFLRKLTPGKFSIDEFASLTPDF